MTETDDDVSGWGADVLAIDDRIDLEDMFGEERGVAELARYYRFNESMSSEDIQTN